MILRIEVFPEWALPISKTFFFAIINRFDSIQFSQDRTASLATSYVLDGTSLDERKQQQAQTASGVKEQKKKSKEGQQDKTRANRKDPNFLF